MSKVLYWVVFGRTESGDDLPILLFKSKPSKDRVNAEYREMLPEEYEEIGFVHWQLDEIYEVYE